MSKYEKKLIVKPGTKVALKNFDSKSHGKYKSHADAQEEFQAKLLKMNQLQHLLYAQNKHSVLVVLQGMDTAGKDGVIRHVLSAMNPQGCTITRYNEPGELEKGHDFLWRVHPHVPAKGEVAIFNRSHYEDVLVPRVHKLVPDKKWTERYELINDFERLLVKETNTTILKLFLHISKNEQLARFKQRLDDPARNWKISESDYSERRYWDEYTSAYEEIFHRTSTDHAPWFIIPSDHKWFRDLAISKLIVETLDNLNMKEPPARVDLAEIRRKYHEESLDAKRSKRK